MSTFTGTPGDDDLPDTLQGGHATQPPSSARTYAHDAFISYSRKDKEFARKLEKALEDYAPPKDLAVPQRHLDVFRDEADFTGVDYFRSVEKHLHDSSNLIVICSPHARQSGYVNDEIRRFAQVNGTDGIIPVLLSGVPNNEAASEEEAQMAFPPALCELMELPLAIEYRGIQVRKDKPDKGAFEGGWHTLLANIYKLKRSEVEQREKKRQATRRKIRRLIASGVIASLSLALVVTWLLYQRAEDQRHTAVSRLLADRSNESSIKERIELYFWLSRLIDRSLPARRAPRSFLRS
jgi:hypothetical protein